MSSKRKWDEEGLEGTPETPGKVAKSEDSRDASSAAATAAAIAAKIAAQFSAGPGKDPHDGDYVTDIDINDIRNRYLLTKGSTQQQIHEDTGAVLSTKGVWYPDRSKATERDPPLYVHISATSQEMLQSAIDKVNELINMDMGSLVEDKSTGRRRKWPEEKILVGIESLRNFNVRAKVVGPTGMFVKYIQQETGTRVQIKGLGSGFVDQETGKESEEPMHIHITGPDENMIQRAKVLTEDLLEVVRGEHQKAMQQMQQQQMELHQAQLQYAAYAATMSGTYQQPGQPGATSSGPEDATPQPPAPTDTEAYAQYWAAYGYDVNSAEFKAWQAQQQAQYAQYYSQQGYPAGSDAAGASAGGGPAPPPPSEPAPPPPPGEAAPPPPPPPQ